MSSSTEGPSKPLSAQAPSFVPRTSAKPPAPPPYPQQPSTQALGMPYSVDRLQGATSAHDIIAHDHALLHD